jgi:DNA-binding LytR/AlgR family response regulator
MRVLIVEDEPIIALEIEAIVLERLPNAEVRVVTSVAEALLEADQVLGLAFLDIDVTDGKTYPLALKLRLNNVPFAFVSGARSDEGPQELVGARFIPKPFCAQDIRDIISSLGEAAECDASEEEAT